LKGIILAGGRATHLYPITKGVCKQMLPVYDKPLIYYPLSTLMLAGIRDILIISTVKDVPRFQDLLGDGSELGIKLSYAEQKSPRGIAESLLIGERFISGHKVCLILGDNIFYGNTLVGKLKKAATLNEGAVVFGYFVNNPQRYGVLGFDQRNKVISLEEKPKKPKSNYAVCGVYFYDHNAVKFAKSLKPSKRGELEITDLNKVYLKNHKLRVELLGRGYAWLDAGTPDALIEASIFIKTVEERQGLKLGCIEEVAYRMNFINLKQLQRLSVGFDTHYGDYLRKICDEEG
jgi:glucose-1-phosphate thymidylyltransferase